MSVIKGDCGTNLEWSFNDVTGALVINGTGPMLDFVDPIVRPWETFAPKIKSISISDGITSIGTGAFSKCVLIKEVIIPKSVERIGDTAFADCKNLNQVVCMHNDYDSPSMVLEYGAFWECENLTSITLPKKGVIGDDYVFYRCKSLKTVRIPEGTSTLYSSVFEGCDSLMSIHIPESVEVIAGFDLEECRSLHSIRLPKSVKQIGKFILQ